MASVNFYYLRIAIARLLAHFKGVHRSKNAHVPVRALAKTQVIAAPTNNLETVRDRPKSQNSRQWAREDESRIGLLDIRFDTRSRHAIVRAAWKAQSTLHVTNVLKFDSIENRLWKHNRIRRRDPSACPATYLQISIKYIPRHWTVTDGSANTSMTKIRVK